MLSPRGPSQTVVDLNAQMAAEGGRAFRRPIFFSLDFDFNFDSNGALNFGHSDHLECRERLLSEGSAEVSSLKADKVSGQT